MLSTISGQSDRCLTVGDFESSPRQRKQTRLDTSLIHSSRRSLVLLRQVGLAAAVASVTLSSHAVASNIVVRACSEDNVVTTLPHMPPITSLGLRPAVTGAVTGDTVDLTQLGTCTITLTGGELATSAANLSIVGSSTATVTIDGNGNGRIFDHQGTGTLEINNLTLTHGRVRNTGSAVLDGGCIDSAGSVSLTSATITGCESDHAGGGVAAKNISANHSTIASNTALYGGGIGVFSNGNATVLNSVVTDNVGGGIFAYAVALYSSSVAGNVAGGGVHAHNVTASNSAITGNSSANTGGGIYANSATISYSNLSGNVAALNGGGLFACKYTLSGTVCSGQIAINHSTFDGNSAGGNGGAIYGGAETIVDSTISGNSAGSGGGLVSSAGLPNSYILTLNNSTVAFNSSSVSNGGVFAFGPANIFSSILAKNIVGNSAAPSDLYCATGNGLTTINSLIMSSNQTTSALTSDPLLAPLAYHGGVNLTHALLANSPAIDAGANNFDHLENDERGTGYPRVVGSNADIGAYERQPNDDEIFYGGFQ